jgi:hypothetical protein
MPVAHIGWRVANPQLPRAAMIAALPCGCRHSLAVSTHRTTAFTAVQSQQATHTHVCSCYQPPSTRSTLLSLCSSHEPSRISCIRNAPQRGTRGRTTEVEHRFRSLNIRTQDENRQSRRQPGISWPLGDLLLAQGVAPTTYNLSASSWAAAAQLELQVVLGLGVAGYRLTCLLVLTGRAPLGHRLARSRFGP